MRDVWSRFFYSVFISCLRYRSKVMHIIFVMDVEVATSVSKDRRVYKVGSARSCTFVIDSHS